ncbi:phosphotransferase [Blastococcus saxobsidens]|uniref:Phosphotransferase n=1 Tax=Blastococcus saxobsidens TaxID=138336 RepID=A0A6L9VXN5_9ACTN|nr:phosphotransferase [Blastococcus saxobsidens]
MLARWDELVARDPSLPPGRSLSVLELERAAARTAFFFAPGDATPLVVAKTAHGADPGVHHEAAALSRAAPAGVAPRALGSLPGVDSLQRGLPGRALRVAPIRVGRSAALTWPAELATLAAGLGDLAAATAAPGVPDAVTDGVIDAALAGSLLSEDTRDAVAGAVARVRARSSVVLGHNDVSPQNVLMHEGRLSGLVDWEGGEDRGLPGGDLWNAGLAWLEQGIGLVRWSEEILGDAFTAAWCYGPYGAALRAAATEVVARSGTPAQLVPDLELVWFARHLGHRMQRPGSHPTSAALVARQLESLVRAHSTEGLHVRA